MSPKQNAALTPDAILQRAFEKETQARDFYAELAAGCSVDFVRDLLERLAAEEAKHMKMIQQMLARLATGRSITS